MRTSIVLGIIAALLLAFILIFERGSLSTRELEQRAGSVLPELVRAKVEKIEIQRKGLMTTLSRDLDSEIDEEGLWHVTSPYKAEADTDAVDTLLGDLEWLHGARQLRDIEPEDRKRFGLEAPRFRLWFTVGTTRVSVRVGSQTPQGDGVYVEASAKNTVYIVGKDFAEALGKEPEHYHTKVLHEGVLVSTARRVTVRDEGGTRVAKARTDGLWTVDGPEGLLASNTAIGGFIDALDALRASRYISGSTKELKKYALDPAQSELTLHKRASFDSLNPNAPQANDRDKPKPKDDGEVLALRLRIGGACGEHTGERYVTLGEGGAIFCAQQADLDKLKLPLAELQERHLLPIEPDEITGVLIEREGLSLVLTRNAESWSFALKRGKETLAQGTARDTSALDWLQALRGVEATDVGARPQISQTASVTKITLSRPEPRPSLVLKVVPDGITDALVQRVDEPHPIAFAATALELVEPSTARFRPLTLLSLAESALTTLEITRGAVVERVERKSPDSPLMITAPLQVEADRIASSDVARLLSSLSALRFAADSAEPAHGLATPVILVRAQFAKHGEQPARSVVVRIGAETEGGRYAALEGERGVFVVSAQLAGLLSAPLVSRTLLAVPLENIAAIELRQAGRKSRVERTGDTFAGVDAANTKVDPALAARIAQALATLRATTVLEYAVSPKPHAALAAPSFEIQVTQRDGSSFTLALRTGAEQGQLEARRSDLDAVFLLPAGALDVVLPLLAAK